MADEQSGMQRQDWPEVALTKAFVRLMQAGRRYGEQTTALRKTADQIGVNAAATNAARAKADEATLLFQQARLEFMSAFAACPVVELAEWLAALQGEIQEEPPASQDTLIVGYWVKPAFRLPELRERVICKSCWETHTSQLDFLIVRPIVAAQEKWECSCACHLQGKQVYDDAE